MGKKLEEHLKLVEAAKRKNVLCVAELHKRFDPIYTDARDRIRKLGPFSYYSAYMSQPKHQLETFKAWAGKSSDISYYLNSHHIDYHDNGDRILAFPAVQLLSRHARARMGGNTDWPSLAMHAPLVVVDVV